MTLQAGSRLGPYEIVAPLGAGGMGEVYRARDTRLGRDVAVKVLPRHLSANPEVRARFEREARTVSSLNHPHICVLHDVGRAPGEAGAGDTDFLVMELVEGETLAARLERGPLPAAETLRIGGQIADALDRAHRAGVIHRDLKPGNVMLARSGAKLMDFGLARGAVMGAAGHGQTHSPTVAAPLTAEGTIVGTFQYMAPEQLEGREADARSDLWALGCVLYEMASGKRAFEGATQASLISAIMRDQPRPLAELSPLSPPPALDRLVRQLLVKDPDERLQSAHDVRLQLASLAEGASPGASPLPATVARARRPGREGIAWAIAALAALLAGIGWWRPHTDEAPALHAEIQAPPGTRLALSGDDAGPPTLSPDGRWLAFSAIGQGSGERLWLRSMDERTARPLPGTDGATFPFWSPDSRSIGFFTGTALRRVDVAGGGVLTVCACDGPRGGAWAPDGTILFSPTFVSGLMRVPAAGGTPAPVTTVDSTREDTHRWPQLLPDGRHFVYLAARHDDAEHHSAIWFGSLDGGRPRKLFDCPSGAVYASGWLLFVRDSTLMAQRFDPGSGAVRGEAIPTREIVYRDGSTWRTPVTASRNGVLVYGVGGAAPCHVTWFDRSGQVVRTLGEPGNYFNLALSVDGRRLVSERQVQPNADLWVEDLATGGISRLTNSPDDDSTPVWLADGSRVVYATRPANGKYVLLIRRSDGGDEPTLLRSEQANDLIPLACSRDDRWLYFGSGDFGYTGVGTAWRLSLAGDHRVERVLPASLPVQDAALSPDGRWLACAAMSTGRAELMVIAAPGSDAPPDTLARRWVLTSEGGNNPCWRADGRELYYNRPDGTIVALSVDGSGGEFHVRSSTALFQAFQREGVRSFQAAPDGQHFAVSVVGDVNGEGFAVVTGWTRALRGR
ncbi:MAG TPA: protein kinase [Candidatus Acidoferrales bacterium]|nr:protein kinase [Candidatus Acidoferrales bacterium]